MAWLLIYVLVPDAAITAELELHKAVSLRCICLASFACRIKQAVPSEVFRTALQRFVRAAIYCVSCSTFMLVLGGGGGEKKKEKKSKRFEWYELAIGSQEILSFDS